MKNNIFYTYVYLDPRKPGRYEYGNYVFEYEPFYVGKGCASRYVEHLEEARKKNNRSGNNHKYFKIKNILQENLEPIILKVQETTSKCEALNLEIWLVWAIGRSDLTVGPLTNHTAGGEGGFGFSRETRDKLSKAGKGRIPWNKGKTGVYSLETINKIQHTFFQKGQTPWNKGKTGVYSQEAIERMSLAKKEKPVSPETRDKLSRAGKGRVASPETKAKISIEKLGEKNPMFGKVPWNKGLKKENINNLESGET